MLKKSPSGSLCPYYFKGGELHPLHYGSYKNDTSRLLNIIDAEEEFILSSAGGRNIWIDLYETNLTDEVVQRLVRHFEAICSKVHRLALVGCGKKVFAQIRACLRERENSLSDQIKYFKDPEDAKDWLVGRI